MSSPQGQDCVELARVSDQIGVRDSKNPDGLKLVLVASAARRLTSKIKAGNLDL